MRCLITDEVKGNGQQNLFTIVAVILHLSNVDFALARADDAEWEKSSIFGHCG